MLPIAFVVIFFLASCYIRELHVHAQKPNFEILIPGVGSGGCSERQVFDSTNLICVECSGDNHIPDLDGGLSSIYPSNRCRCEEGYEAVPTTSCEDQNGDCLGFACRSCSPLSSYSDGSGCVACDNATTLNIVNPSNSATSCICQDSTHVLLEKDATGGRLSAKICLECPVGSQVITKNTKIAGVEYEIDPYTCQFCPDTILMTMSQSGGTYTCSCVDGYQMTGVATVGAQQCVASTLADEFTNEATFSALQVTYKGSAKRTITSATFQHYYLQAVAKCTNFGSPEGYVACQVLANLCVLQMYDVATDACRRHIRVVELRSLAFKSHPINNWVKGNPWLYLSNGGDACYEPLYSRRLSLQNSFLTYNVASYTLNGTFLGFQPLETLFSFCTRQAPNSNSGGGTNSNTKYQTFGHSLQTNYTCQLSNLYEATSLEGIIENQRFYEIYLKDNKQKQEPIPVRVVNMRSDDKPEGGINALYPKRMLCDKNDQLVRRFFLKDLVSGITFTSAQVGEYSEVIRYADYISLDMALDPERLFKVFAPILTIHYAEIPGLSSQDILSGGEKTVPISLNANYTMDISDFENYLYAFFVLTTVIASLYFALKVYYWNIRHSRSPQVVGINSQASGGGINFKSIFEISVLVCQAWNAFFFPFTLFICFYFFTFFKVQYLPLLMMPPQYEIGREGSPYFMFVANVYVMAFFQLYVVIVMVVKQCRADIFFIDWEPFKVESSTKGKKKNGGSEADSHVSVWRSIMVANEWSEMQTIRKTDIRFTLFWLAFVLIGLDLQYNATIQPSLEDLDPNQINVVLRFANSCFFWLLFSSVQYLFKYLFYERFYGEPPEQVFVDFCTIAKVSVLVLDEPYHGWYLHCRSPHQYADGSMTELVEMLHKEEAGLVTDRGLEGAPVDIQSFEVFLSAEFRSAFDRIFVKLCGVDSVQGSITAQGREQRPNRGRGGSAGSVRLGSVNYLPSEKVMLAWKELTVFLQEFVQNHFGKSGMRRTVKEATYFEKMVRAAPDLTIPEQPSVFQTDKEYDYVAVLFLGREYQLLLLNILAYSLFDLWFNDVAISLLLTYLLEFVICSVRQAWGQRTLSRKTLIDERFLI